MEISIDKLRSFIKPGNNKDKNAFYKTLRMIKTEQLREELKGKKQWRLF